ncbi:hypothetical protein [Limnochorda pilosa]|uniref:hypothetical protein n=1 Tax=Limnochorda pilosa TaxID=1555112 RepID=UPI00083518D0|nr:hypothetical protein [Limnochorda pilosa]
MSLDLFATVPTLNESRLNTLAPPHAFRGISHLAPGQTAGRGEGSFDVEPYARLLQRLTGVDLLQEEPEGVTRVPKEERSTTRPFRVRRVPPHKVAEVAAHLAGAFERSPDGPPAAGAAERREPVHAATAAGGAVRAPGGDTPPPVAGGDGPPPPPEDGAGEERPLTREEWQDLVRFFQVCAQRRYAVTIRLE